MRKRGVQPRAWSRKSDLRGEGSLVPGRRERERGLARRVFLEEGGENRSR